MRSAILSVLILSSASLADDTARRVKVALALASASQCGECRYDEAGCRLEAAAKGVPLVLFVGDACARLGKHAREAGAVACVVKTYPHDGLAETPRAVVLSPDGKGGWWKGDVLPAPTAATLKAAVEKAKPTPTPAKDEKKLNWSDEPSLTEVEMIRPFLAAVAVAVLPADADAQLPPSPYASPCPGGVCPRVQAAVTQVRAAGADVLHRAGVVVGGPVSVGQRVQSPHVVNGPVGGYWSDPTVRPWHTPLPPSVPQTMPQAPPQLVFSGPLLGMFGIRRVVIEFASPLPEGRSLARPFGGRFRR